MQHAVSRVYSVDFTLVAQLQLSFTAQIQSVLQTASPLAVVSKSIRQMTATTKEELEQRIFVPESESKIFASVQSDVIMLVVNDYQVGT